MLPWITSPLLAVFPSAMATLIVASVWRMISLTRARCP
jgi:hypothetical protein